MNRKFRRDVRYKRLPQVKILGGVSPLMFNLMVRAGLAKPA